MRMDEHTNKTTTMDWIDNRLTIYADTEANLKHFLASMSGSTVHKPWGKPGDVAKKIHDAIHYFEMTPAEAVRSVCGFEACVKLLNAEKVDDTAAWLEGLQARINTLELECDAVFGSPGPKPFSFARAHPIPKEIYPLGKALGGIPWCLENWGSRYDAIKPAILESGWKDSVKGHVAVVTFITVDLAPKAFIEYIAGKFDKVVLSLVSFDYFQNQIWGAVGYQGSLLDFSPAVSKYKSRLIVEQDGALTHDLRAAEQLSHSMVKEAANHNLKKNGTH